MSGTAALSPRPRPRRDAGLATRLAPGDDLAELCVQRLACQETGFDVLAERAEASAGLALLPVVDDDLVDDREQVDFYRAHRPVGNDEGAVCDPARPKNRRGCSE